jgi:hypothetical protein
MGSRLLGRFSRELVPSSTRGPEIDILGDMRLLPSRTRSGLAAAFLLSLGASVALAAPADVLAAAQKIAADLKDWTYGHDAAKKQIDCVQFVIRVLKDLAPGLSREAQTRILISDVSESEVAGLVEKEDPKIRGVQTALVEAHLGQAVAREDVKPGDLVQYWYRTKDGGWNGHCAIVEEVRAGGKFALLGAHQSHGKIDTLVATFGPGVKTYFVRFTGG